jgi:hypothetical protein
MKAPSVDQEGRNRFTSLCCQVFPDWPNDARWASAGWGVNALLFKEDGCPIVDARGRKWDALYEEVNARERVREEK